MSSDDFEKLFTDHKFFWAASLLIGLAIGSIASIIILTGGTVFGFDVLNGGLIATNLPLALTTIATLMTVLASIFLSTAIVYFLRGTCQFIQFLIPKNNEKNSKNSDSFINRLLHPLQIIAGALYTVGRFCIAPFRGARTAIKNTLSTFVGLTVAAFATLFVLTGFSVFGLDVPIWHGGLLAKAGPIWITSLFSVMTAAVSFLGSFILARSIYSVFVDSNHQELEFEPDGEDFVEEHMHPNNDNFLAMHQQYGQHIPIDAQKKESATPASQENAMSATNQIKKNAIRKKVSFAHPLATSSDSSLSSPSPQPSPAFNARTAVHKRTNSSSQIFEKKMPNSSATL